MTSLDKVWKYLGMVWSIAAFIAAVSFFFGGQWQDWKKIRAEYNEGKFGRDDMTGFVSQEVLSEKLGEYVSMGDLDSAVGTLGFVRFRDRIHVLNEYNYPNNAMVADTGNSTVVWSAVNAPKYLGGNEWYLERAN